jgi:CRP-like cAMP-binding protein
VQSTNTDELAATALFGGLTEDDWPELLSQALRVELGANEPVLLQGEEAEALFVVISGSVDVRAKNSSGADQLLAHRTAGAMLGEIGLLLGGQHSASVYAAEPSTLLRFGREALMGLLESGHHGAMRVLYNIARTLAVRLREADARITELASARPPEQTASATMDDLDRLRTIFFTEWT